MKTQKIILGLLILGLNFVSCSKNDDDDVQIVENTPEYPMKSLIEDGVIELKNTTLNSPNTFELGYKFKSFKNGQITALGIRVPDNDIYRVTLWNVDTEEILKTINITSSSGLLSFEDIEPVNIESGTLYFISINTNDYYIFNDDGNVVFPVETDNILVTGYGSKLGQNQSLPTQFTNTAYLGMVDIKFTANN
ncbi:DUF4082 domain-containing protein [Flavivirga aquimarina]|uniref:DUF4082 domain-containing protein n=1 Tax=Flavivirga aquimarina TaxID=2027862 RepID=A0ABT8WD54_9FLAO|nr:DUF4082 domain-containing protein [Flavivirga aquimarina]MDO5971087.1 DUF4082 domain-containing protein [Flavivirga aquimarina]